MAKQVGDIILAGTIDDITFYEMEGKGYARRKSSLTGKKLKKDPRFKRTLQRAGAVTTVGGQGRESKKKPGFNNATGREQESCALGGKSAADPGVCRQAKRRVQAKGKRKAAAAACAPSSDGWRAHQQREQDTNRSCVLK